MAGYSTKITAEAQNPEGKTIARLTVEHMELDYAGLVQVEGSIQNLLDEQFSWGQARLESGTSSQPAPVAPGVK